MAGGIGLEALIWREWQRLRRSPALARGRRYVVVPYAADALARHPDDGLLGAGIVRRLSRRSAGSGLTRSGGLARCLPFSLARSRWPGAVPAIVVAIWTLAVVPAFVGLGTSVTHRDPISAFFVALATAAAGLLAAVRWTQAKGIDFGAPMIATQAGAFPPGLMTNLFRGFDVALLVTFPMLLGGSPFWSLAMPPLLHWSAQLLGRESRTGSAGRSTEGPGGSGSSVKRPRPRPSNASAETLPPHRPTPAAGKPVGCCPKAGSNRQSADGFERRVRQSSSAVVLHDTLVRALAADTLCR